MTGPDTSQLSTIADLASVVIAGLAFVAAIVSILLTRQSVRSQDKHNRLSLRPLPQISVGDYENRIFVKVVNNGPGPLVIEEIIIVGPDEPAGDLISLMPKAPTGIFWKDFVIETKNRSIRSGDELILVGLEGDPKSAIFSDFKNEARLSLSKLTVKVRFTDVYGSKFEPCERALSWFSR